MSLGEIEDFLTQELLIMDDARHSQKEKRFIAVGLTKKKRPMLVAFTARTKGGEILIRPISARYCHKKEADTYETIKKNIKK
ncbi:MAG: BrnT family toxin [Xanthomonadaceae bacterium]|nr:BrnT family toxin [Xanthomonadaceae bacterium]